MKLVLLNGIVIVVAGLLAKLLSKFFSKSQLEFTLVMVNIVVLIVGIMGAIETKLPILMLVSIVIGSLLGSIIDIDGKLQQFGKSIENKFAKRDEGFSKAFIMMVMIHCIGSMAIIGPLNLGLTGDGNILWIKTILDFISTLIYGSIYGLGVIASALVVVLYQGSIFLLAKDLSAFLSPEVIVEIGAVGSVLIVALALDLLDIKKIKIANGLPAILIVILYQWVALW